MNGRDPHDDEARYAPRPKTPREVIVVMDPAAGGAALGGAEAPALRVVEGVRLRPVFERRGEAAPSDRTVEPAVAFFRAEVSEDAVDDVCSRLAASDSVTTCYVKPRSEPAQHLNTMVPRVNEAPPATPDFTGRQGYLNAAPGGVDARFAWTQPGGRGAGIRIIDVEGEWRFGHEDLKQNQGGVVGGTPPGELLWRNHGTAVIGEFGADANAFGVTGICPEANVRAISVFGIGSATAIQKAADLLSPGDIILIELHRAGPRFNFDDTRPDQLGFIPIEWWPDDYLAIRYAVGRGVIVVEAAGNGAEDLDAALYDQPAPGFPATWRNPFRRGARDSGAILVGAGAPPPAPGRDWGPDRSRLDFSNYGAAVDAQGWGAGVVTTGYGDLQGGSNEDFWYTEDFSGTSSASPIVVGALASVQGILRAQSRPLLTPATARQHLRATGSAQQDAPGQPRSERIGNRPDIRQLVAAVTAPPHELDTRSGVSTSLSVQAFLDVADRLRALGREARYVVDLDASNASTLRVTTQEGLAWCDVPSAAIASVGPREPIPGRPSHYVVSLAFHEPFASIEELVRTASGPGIAASAAALRSDYGEPGLEADLAPRLLRAPSAPPQLPIDPDLLVDFLDRCRTAGVTYGLGKKVPFHGAVPGVDWKKVDCSGFVREAIWVATTPNFNFKDGSVVQHDWVRDQGFQKSSVDACALADGIVRIAFLPPAESPTNIGHVVLVYMGETIESRGGVGPDRREWTGSGWQSRTTVYVLSIPTA